jgi:hypothetical protein
LTLLAVAALLAGGGMMLAYRAKSKPLKDLQQQLASRQALNLNQLSAREDLLPALSMFANPTEREFVARKIYYIAGGLSNVGAIARIRVTAAEIGRGRALKALRDRLGNRESIPLLTPDQVRDIKAQFVVRSPGEFRRAFFRWAALFFIAFFAAHVWLSLRGFRGDELFLPAVLLLTGIGFALMLSLRDPVRDNMLFVDFAQGAAAGALILAAAAGVDYERALGKLSFVPLLASFALSALLIVFGYGPGASDAKVNLFGFQPVS